jgi:hypothetical protein
MNEPEHERVPAQTTPTWEMELLVSGATIFGLLQLPTFLDHAYFRVATWCPVPTQADDALVAVLEGRVVTLVLTFSRTCACAATGSRWWA